MLTLNVKSVVISRIESSPLYNDIQEHDHKEGVLHKSNVLPCHELFGD